MDMEICQVDKVYLHYLQQYQIVLRQRNQLLKDMAKKGPNQDLVQVYDEQFAEYACRLITRRRSFLKQLAEIAPKIHEQISGNTEKIEFVYEANVPEDTEQILRKLSGNFEQDLRFGTTSVGPHRDDIGIKINDIDVRTYGSQGQKRTSALSMKLAEVEMMVPSYGFCEITPCEEFAENVCDELLISGYPSFARQEAKNCLAIPSVSPT